ncbi:unnamed protein product [Kluyveromyces dobzhanskii CBS 2104]|uniref:WGS project CCBQ000000000 data, contig 00006 n=1 Tax=Kluyveromyces dobzhanskii CBS 2104 TaxID=1427455 RepID=A0A0A8LAK9_9SACH|nr:unnamed protein product [Kluyveromyces dobzhanskii CBS 2104]
MPKEEPGTSSHPLSNMSASTLNSKICCNSNNLSYDKSLLEKESAWLIESQQKYMELKWYQRPTKRILYLILTLHTMTSTILMGPVVMLTLQNICTFETIPVTHHHGSGGMSMTGNMRRMNMGGGVGSPDECKNKNSQEALSSVQSILSLISGILGCFLSGKYGQLSDRFGRVFVFKIFSLINLLYSFCLVIYFTFFKTYHKLWMIVFLSVGYLSGGIMTLIANGNSYLNDIVKAEKRTVSISVLMSVIYTSLGVGPLLGSFIVKTTGNNNMIPLYISSVLGTVTTVLTFILLKESRHTQAMALANEIYIKKNSTKNRNDSVFSFVLGSLQGVLSFLTPIRRLWLSKTPTGSIKPRVNVLTLVFIDNLNMAVTIGTMSPIILLSIWKYNWTSVEIGYYMSISGFGKALVLLAFAPAIFTLLQRRSGITVNPHCVDSIDKIIIFFSLIVVILSLLVVVCVNSSTGIYLGIVLQSLSGMISPVTQSAIAKYSSNTEVGEMFGAIALVRHLGMLIFPILFLQIYSHTIKFNAKLFLYVTLFVSVVTVFASIVGLNSYNRQEEVNDAETVPLESSC